jgi:hypothetical protein
MTRNRVVRFAGATEGAESGPRERDPLCRGILRDAPAATKIVSHRHRA